MSYEVFSKTTPGQKGLKKALAKLTDNPKRPVVGSWLMLPGHSIARMTAQFGYDFVLIDCEHGNIDDSNMHMMVDTIASHGSSPLVRIPGPENIWVKRTLDAGAHGLLCPMMNTKEDAERFVAMTKFPVPRATLLKNPDLVSGTRGVGSPMAPAVFDQSLPEYVASANENIFIGVQIETRDGLNNCEEIAKVKGIDMLFVGPNDLCQSLGYASHLHPETPEVQEGIAKVLKACKDAGICAGMFCTDADQIKKWFSMGFDVFNLGADVVAIGSWNAQQLGQLDGVL